MEADKVTLKMYLYIELLMQAEKIHLTSWLNSLIVGDSCWFCYREISLDFKSV